MERREPGDASDAFDVDGTGTNFGAGGGAALLYDEDGGLVLARARDDGRHAAADAPAMPARLLNGSWYLHFVPEGPHTAQAIRGPMRIEVAPPRVRISGDVYVARAGTGATEVLHPFVESAALFGRKWYPQLPMKQYAWHFRSVGVEYIGGVLTFKFERRVWSQMTQEFVATDTGWMKFECRGEITNHASLPEPALTIKGKAQVGAVNYQVVATKTSTLYRGCKVEVDVMTNRAWPLTASTCAGAEMTFSTIYATAGWDCPATISDTDIPEDAQLTTAELHTALATHRSPMSTTGWRLWMLIGSAQGTTFGVMFDDQAPHREGVVGFYDPTLPNDPLIEVSARGQKLGDVPAAFMRTLVHEAGHAFNLFHPKHDVHTVPIGPTIMNQTGDVMGFATAEQPYPCNAVFRFDDHSRTSLIHSPDPQVAPGGKPFGWGHGGLFGGIAEPTDAAGLMEDTADSTVLTLELKVPETVFRGEFVTATFVLKNVGDEPVLVTRALNLSQGDLRLRVTPPAGLPQDVRDVIVACGDRSFDRLAPGEIRESVAQIFYTTAGRTFRQTGRYYVSAELDTGTNRIVRSAPAELVVRAPANEAEQEISRLMLDDAVARSLALGDFVLDTDARAKLEALADRHADTASGAAAALVLANALGKPLRDVRSRKIVRKAEVDNARKRVASTMKAHGETRTVCLAVAVAAPTDADAAVLSLAEDALGKATKGRAQKGAAKTAGKDAPRGTLSGLRHHMAR
ncbi:MAG: hypothetical protein ACHQRO_04730 [Vicinamibacteria bacterium]